MRTETRRQCQTSWESVLQTTQNLPILCISVNDCQSAFFDCGVTGRKSANAESMDNED